MRNNRLLILGISAVCIVAVTVYYQSALRQAERADVFRRAAQEQASAALRAEISRLTRLQEELRASQDLGQQALESGRADMRGLEEKLSQALEANRQLQQRVEDGGKARSGLLAELAKNAEAAASLQREKDALVLELEVLRKNFDVVHSVRIRVSEMEKSLSELGLKPGKEDLIRLHLEQMLAQLEKTNEYLLLVRDAKTDLSAAVPAAGAKQTVAAVAGQRLSLDQELKAHDELLLAKNQLDVLTKDHAVIKEKYRLAEETLSREKSAAAGRDATIFELQKKLIEAENNLAAVRDKYAALEKSSAELREKYVASELEKENLRVRLTQTASELEDLRAKFVSLLGRISGLFNAADDRSGQGQPGGPGGGKIGVELIPQQSAQ